MEMEIWLYWYIASAVLLLLEAALIPGAGLLFAAMGALCLGFIVQSGLIADDSFVAQWGAFFFATAFWAAVLWKPLKNFSIGGKKSNTTHHDMIGRFATVGENGLQKGKKGAVKWSGTTMNAKLADDASIDSAAAGDELKIVALQSSVLILAESGYEIKTEDN